MKTNIRRQVFYLCICIGLALLVLAIVLPTKKHDRPEIVTTPSTKPLPARAGNADSAEKTTSSAANEPNGTVSRQTTKQERIAVLAPKYQQVTAAVTDEIEYRVLASVNDPLAQNQWYLDGVKAGQAWDTINTSKSATVAIIDSGYALDHQDLTNKWHTNPGETGQTTVGSTCWDGSAKNKSTNNCDDDANGYVDDWRGWDFYYADNSPAAGSENPDGDGVSHGTEVAGLVGAQANNGVGVASVGYTNTIMPLQIMSDEGYGYTSDIVAAVYYAVDNGADVINMSLGTAYQDNSLKTALQYAYDHNVIVVAAAGNCGQAINDGVCNLMPQGTITYPARYGTVIAVGAVDSAKKRAGFSSYGKELDVSAPGSGTLPSTSWAASNQQSAYATTLYGTSFASPVVASIAGLIKAENPGLSVRGAKAILVANSQKLPDMNGAFYTTPLGHGLVDSFEVQRLAKGLVSGSSAVSLLLTGNSVAESRYSPDTTMAAGCEAANGAWCGVWFTNSSGYDRYLPFKQISSQRESWTWQTAGLQQEVWEARAISGNSLSADKQLLQK